MQQLPPPLFDRLAESCVKIAEQDVDGWPRRLDDLVHCVVVDANTSLICQLHFQTSHRVSGDAEEDVSYVCRPIGELLYIATDHIGHGHSALLWVVIIRLIGLWLEAKIRVFIYLYPTIGRSDDRELFKVLQKRFFTATK
jgi:hypothetical protein